MSAFKKLVPVIGDTTLINNGVLDFSFCRSLERHAFIAASEIAGRIKLLSPEMVCGTVLSSNEPGGSDGWGLRWSGTRAFWLNRERFQSVPAMKLCPRQAPGSGSLALFSTLSGKSS